MQKQCDLLQSTAAGLKGLPLPEYVHFKHLFWYHFSHVSYCVAIRKSLQEMESESAALAKKVDGVRADLTTLEQKLRQTQESHANIQQSLSNSELIRRNIGDNVKYR